MSNTRLIPLTQGKFAIVDADAYEFLSKWKWRYVSGYASRRKYGEVCTEVKMHRIIMDSPEGLEVDHIDGDPLNNARENLRICTHLQNSWNRKIPKSNTSGFKGVSYRKDSGKWRARIGIKMKRIILGEFATLEAAVEAYKVASVQYHGEFAR